MYKIRAFRAVEDLDSCKKFAEGHLNVLVEYGVTKVTTAKTDWFHNPGVYVVLIETEDGSKVVGGERIHLTNRHAPLPVEEAVSIVDTKVYGLVDQYREVKSGELCGLWNSKDIAGKGFSVLLTKMGVALAKILDMQTLFVLCAPYTVAMCQSAGFVIEESLGNKGTFFYPKLDLVATVLMIKDLSDLSTADPAFSERIADLAANPVQQSTEDGPKGSFEVIYNLSIS